MLFRHLKMKKLTPRFRVDIMTTDYHIFLRHAMKSIIDKKRSRGPHRRRRSAGEIPARREGGKA